MSSNYRGRKTEFTPPVYTRYFEHETQSTSSSNGHIYFGDEDQTTSSTYQTKRDLVFKRLFPAKFADSNNNSTTAETSVTLLNTSENEFSINEQQLTQNGDNRSLTIAAQSLGDFIPLSNIDSTTNRKNPSPEPDIVLSTSSDNDDSSIDESLSSQEIPTSHHESISARLHSRSAIENVRTILIRELYQVTNDANTEWLKCKMNLSKTFIHPRYYADFRRRYRKEIEKNSGKNKKKSTSTKRKSNDAYHVVDLTTTEETIKMRRNEVEQNGEITESTRRKQTTQRRFTSPSSSPIATVIDTTSEQHSIDNVIVLDSDDDDDDNTDKPNVEPELVSDKVNSSFFIDRSSSSFSSSIAVKNDEDYRQEDSKYAALPSLPTSSIIRPIVSKHQRRQQNTTSSATPLVAAIDRIIDHMDLPDSFIDSKSTTVIKQVPMKKKNKKRKQKKMNKLLWRGVVGKIE